PAIILGHVDSRAGPAAFFRLRELRPRDIVRVGLADGRILVFRVQRVRRYPKDRFPAEAVYFPTLNRELRLITCGGEFDYASRNYRDNIVVYAALIASTAGMSERADDAVTAKPPLALASRANDGASSGTAATYRLA